jgi:hypothetical protein
MPLMSAMPESGFLGVDVVEIGSGQAENLEIVLLPLVAEGVVGFQQLFHHLEQHRRVGGRERRVGGRLTQRQLGRFKE